MNSNGQKLNFRFFNNLKNRKSTTKTEAKQIQILFHAFNIKTIRDSSEENAIRQRIILN